MPPGKSCYLGFPKLNPASGWLIFIWHLIGDKFPPSASGSLSCAPIRTCQPGSLLKNDLRAHAQSAACAGFAGWLCQAAQDDPPTALLPANSSKLSFPLERRVNYYPWLFCGSKHIQRLADHIAVGMRIICRTQRSAQRKVNKQCPRRFHILRHLPAHDDANGRNPRLFQYTRNQSHGLLANRSAGHQQSGFCSGVFQKAGSRWRSFFQ